MTSLPTFANLTRVEGGIVIKARFFVICFLAAACVIPCGLALCLLSCVPIRPCSAVSCFCAFPSHPAARYFPLDSPAMVCIPQSNPGLRNITSFPRLVNVSSILIEVITVLCSSCSLPLMSVPRLLIIASSLVCACWGAAMPLHLPPSSFPCHTEQHEPGRPRRLLCAQRHALVPADQGFAFRIEFRAALPPLLLCSCTPAALDAGCCILACSLASLDAQLEVLCDALMALLCGCPPAARTTPR